MHQGLGIHHSTTVHWKLKAILKLRMFPLRLTFCNFQFYPLAKFKTSISILFLYSGPMDIWRGLLYFSEASFLKVETVPVIVNQGWFCLPRDTGPCLETFTIVAPGKGDGPGIQWAEAKEAAGCTGQPPAPPTKNQLVYNVHSAEAEKPWSRGGDFHQQQGLHVLCMCCGVPLSLKSGCHEQSQYSGVPYTNGRSLVHPLPPCPPQLNTDRGHPGAQDTYTPSKSRVGGENVFP